MADDERPDAQVEQWLRVEPLDDVTRRRLVSTALRESGLPQVSNRSEKGGSAVAAAALNALLYTEV